MDTDIMPIYCFIMSCILACTHACMDAHAHNTQYTQHTDTHTHNTTHHTHTCILHRYWCYRTCTKCTYQHAGNFTFECTVDVPQLTPDMYSKKMQICFLVRSVPKYFTMRSCWSFLRNFISNCSDSTACMGVGQVVGHM